MVGNCTIVDTCSNSDCVPCFCGNHNNNVLVEINNNYFKTKVWGVIEWCYQRKPENETQPFQKTTIRNMKALKATMSLIRDIQIYFENRRNGVKVISESEFNRRVNKNAPIIVINNL